MKSMAIIVGLIFSVLSVYTMDSKSKVKSSSGQISQDSSQSMGTPGRENKKVAHSPGRSGSSKKPTSLVNSNGIEKTKVTSKQDLMRYMLDKQTQSQPKDD